MNTLNARALALSGAAAGAILVALCFAIYLVLGQSDPWMPLFVGSGPTVGGWLVGITEGAGVGGLLGWIVATFYNRLAARSVA
jgi:hypothetical protein